MEKYYEFGPVTLAKHTVWLRFYVIDDKIEKMYAQERGKIFQDVELSEEEMTQAIQECQSYVVNLYRDEIEFFNGTFANKIEQLLAEIPSQDLKIDGLEMFKESAKKMIEVLRG